MSGSNSRDWLLDKLQKLENVTALAPINEYLIKIERTRLHSETALPPFVAAVISTKVVNGEDLVKLKPQDGHFEFVTNIPKDAIWTGAAITCANVHSIGWGGVGDLMSAINDEVVADYQNREFVFVERGLKQHNRIEKFYRLFDRIIEIHRTGLPTIKVAILNDYELTGEHVRHARDIYGEFSIIVKTNPNGRPTSNAYEAAKAVEAELLSWREFLGRLHRK